MKVPKIIHFIWAGGEKIIPSEGLQNILNWANKNPGFLVKIHIDQQSDPNYYPKYEQAFAKLTPTVPQSIIFQDIKKHCSPEIRYEINALAPNYGASSDMLRYIILFNEGGAYFDCLDVFPHDFNHLASLKFGDQDKLTPGENVFDTELAVHRLLLHLTPHSLLGNGKAGPGSEALMCTKDNPTMATLAKEAKKPYHNNRDWVYKTVQCHPPGNNSPSSKPPLTLFAPPPRMTPLKGPVSRLKQSMTTQILYEETANKPKNKIEELRGKNTLDSTGPGMVIRVLSKKTGKIPDTFLMPYSSDGSQNWVSFPPQHAGSWGQLRIKPYSLQEAIKNAAESMDYEFTHMKLFNLSYHIDQIAQSVIKYNKKNNIQDPSVQDWDVINNQLYAYLEQHLSSTELFSHYPKPSFNLITHRLL